VFDLFYRLSSSWQTSVVDVHCCDALVLVVAYSLAKIDSTAPAGVDDVDGVGITAGAGASASAKVVKTVLYQN